MVFNPLIVKDSPSISLRKTKTDKIDARSIACTLFYLQHQLPSSPFLNPEFRDIVRERESAKAIQNAPIDALNAFFSKSAGRKPKLSVAFLKELAS
ncbi:IS110 family transposase, partial [Fervidobacterium gondwanense]|uniref:IS110 family transposase n=1 Tax=Fervidobacterium gondwanense TaxID=44754 RepID=UPI003C78FC1F